jgi:hypothetical protein
LDYTLSCDLCLKSFSFPSADPSNSLNARWSYRVIGPFALPDYARGGYAAALAIRFFGNVIGLSDTEVTWSSGQTLTLPSGKEAEADFIIWYQRRQMFGTDYPTEVVFGEAKSFGNDRFQERDTARLRVLAEAFPGSILVFATLRQASDLNRDEVQRVRKLAEWGREYDRERRHTRAPVILLTGTELFAAHHLDLAWKDKGGKHAELINPGYVRADHLKTLADLTQQLYLGMPSYGEWLEAKWKCRSANKRKGCSQ